MENITIMNTSPAEVQPLQPKTYLDFLDYIDRSDRTTAAYLINLRQFAVYLAYKGISRPTRQDVISYRQYLTTPHEALEFTPAGSWTYRLDGSGNRITATLKPGTAAQYIRSVKQFFKWTASAGIYPNIADNVHAPRVKTDRHKKEALKPVEVMDIERSILDGAKAKTATAATADKDTAGRIDRATEQGKRLYALFVLATNAGLRTVELERLNVRDLECRGGNASIYLWRKGHAEADIKKPLAPEVYAILKDYLDSRSDGAPSNSPMFTATGNRSKGQRIAARTISGMIKQAMKDAGYNSDKLTAHSMRHTAGTNVMAMTGNLYETQKYLDHISPTTTEVYLHDDDPEQQRETANDLYKRLHGQDTDAQAKQELLSLIGSMNAAQLARLTAAARKIAKS